MRGAWAGGCAVHRVRRIAESVAKGRMYLEPRNEREGCAHEQVGWKYGPESHVSEKTCSPPQGYCEPAFFPGGFPAYDLENMADGGDVRTETDEDSGQGRRDCIEELLERRRVLILYRFRHGRTLQNVWHDICLFFLVRGRRRADVNWTVKDNNHTPPLTAHVSIMTHSPKANQGERNDVLLGMPSSDTVKRHLSSLRLFQFSSWALSLLLVYLASYLPQFDSSPEVIANLTPTDTTSDNLLLHALQRLPLLRWDAFYFGHIALRGYVYEQEWAFFPGISFVMRNSARLWNLIFARDLSAPLTWNGVLIGGFAATCFTQTAPTLYHLTLHHLGSPSAAYLTALLSLLSSSPATLRLVAYTEPFFTFFSYKGMSGGVTRWIRINCSVGMLYCAKSQWFLASLSFALAGTFRSNGFMLGGFILYGLLIEPVLYRKRVRIFSSHIHSFIANHKLLHSFPYPISSAPSSTHQ